ncbi:MAG: VOC family protein [Parasphingopyxis sp.]
MPVKPAIIPCLCYEDAPAAIDFLCDAFGFERRAVYADDEDPSLIHHAQLALDGNLIMLSTATTGEEWSEAAAMKTPRQAAANTVSIYVVIDDVDAHCARARAAGATIIREPRDEDYGGRDYGALDPEGYAWSFGSYDPSADAP